MRAWESSIFFKTDSPTKTVILRYCEYNAGINHQVVMMPALYSRYVAYIELGGNGKVLSKSRTLQVTGKGKTWH